MNWYPRGEKNNQQLTTDVPLGNFIFAVHADTYQPNHRASIATLNRIYYAIKILRLINSLSAYES